MSEGTLRKRLTEQLIAKISEFSFVAGPPAAAVVGDYDRDLSAKVRQALARQTGQEGSGMCVSIACRWRSVQAKLVVARIVIQVSENVVLNRGEKGTQNDSGDVAFQLLVEMTGWAPEYFSQLTAPERGDQLSLVANTDPLLVWEVVFETMTQLP